MTRLQAPKGTRDLLPDEWARYKRIEASFIEWGERFGFQLLEMPIFESTSVFSRAVGEETDIVSKEMYTFNDRNGDSFSLRPEGTAPLVRAFVENSLQQKLPQKLLYSGPMFRYERPQKGRYRQFYQLGAELIGLETPLADVEILALAHSLLKDIGLSNLTKLELNTIGNSASRATFLEAFKSYMTQYKSELSDESKERLEKNPLRILDSKQSQDQKFVADAPKLSKYLDDESQKHFDVVLNGLTALGIDYSLNDRLVRGLDYYSHTVFEFTTSHLGAQNAVLSGGRYDHLVKQFGGPQLSGIGWGAGLDRLVLLDSRVIQNRRPVCVLALSEEEEPHALAQCQNLRNAGLYSEMIYGKQVGKKLKKAGERFNAIASVLIGGDEGVRGECSLKWMDTGEQQLVNLKDLSHMLVNSSIIKNNSAGL